MAEYLTQQGRFLPGIGLYCCAMFLICESHKSSHWYLQQFSYATSDGQCFILQIFPMAA